MNTFLPSIFYQAPLRCSAAMLLLIAVAVETCVRVAPDQAVALLATVVTVMLCSTLSLPFWAALYSGK